MTNAVLTIALAGVLAQTSGGPDFHIPPCDGPCLTPAPIKTDTIEGQLQERTRWTAADVLDAMNSASPRARCVVRSEVGGVGFNPYAIGSQGERGPVQLHPRGLLADYTRWSGGRPPEDPVSSIRYLDAMLAAGRGRNWSAVLDGRC